MNELGPSHHPASRLHRRIYILALCVQRHEHMSVCTLDGKGPSELSSSNSHRGSVEEAETLRGLVPAFYVVTDFASMVAAAQASCFHSQGVPALPSNPHP